MEELDEYISYYQFDNLKIYYIKNDRCVGKIIGNGGIWEPWMEKFIKHFYIKGTDMIDIGANIGAITFQQMSKHITDANKIYCFEPYFGDIIEKTIIENNIKNVILHKVALSDSNKFLYLPKIDLTKDFNFGGCSIINVPVNTQNENYNCYKLDHFNLKNVSLIKIDVEGHEIDLLNGMIDTLKNNNFPTLLLEIWSFSKGWVYDCIKTKHNIGIDIIVRLVETYKILQEFGYIMYHIDGDDFLFVHKSKKDLLAEFIKNNE